MKNSSGLRVPSEICQACRYLGIEPPASKHEITIQFVELAWKKRVTVIASDLTNDLLNAKNTVVRWLRENPKGDQNQSSPVPRKPLPGAGSGSIAIPHETL